MVILHLRPDLLRHCQNNPGKGHYTYQGVPIQTDEAGRPRYVVTFDDAPLEALVPDPLLDEVVGATWKAMLRPTAGLKPGRYLFRDTAQAFVRAPEKNDDHLGATIYGTSLEAAYAFRHALEIRPQDFSKPAEGWEPDDDGKVRLADLEERTADRLAYKCPSCHAACAIPVPNRVQRRRCRSCGVPYLLDVAKMQTAAAPPEPPPPPNAEAIG